MQFRTEHQHAVHLPLESSNAILALSGVTKSFDSGGPVLSDFSLTVTKGEFLSILGPSGCGKSTLLRLISGLEEPTSGRIEVDHGPAATDELGFVFQEPTLLPWTTVFGNVHWPLKIKGISAKKAAEQVMEALALVGLADSADKWPSELSGGMKMRVSIARALITKPKILLMDEPFAALDEITRNKLNDDLLELWERFGWTIVFVTHSVYESVYLSSRLVVMSRQQGRVVRDFEVEAPYPRGREFRLSTPYAELCRQAVDALEQASV
ncbi:ABC transporter ATP-binding protein [Pseudovibrio sp. SPO723]|uniref:ABC transporter ATP-binding protein n=1 Tax=Nesiotobacter zosterae TaxID=392721 RepID=UPI0029C17A40|nr:ABC transporter ATP-binding protein [Pseudovibrio sp. SPO723]MDX5594752.1 ABC transporter ATP-binding protein [Pseudovibrio sp. SPO723]